MAAMLRYLGSGVRRFGLYPVTLHRRTDWEFFAKQCGFSSAADFCRVFKDYNNISSRAWLRAKLEPYRERPTRD